MVTATTFFIILLGLSAGFVATAWLLALRMTPESKRARLSRWLLNWAFKGLLTPLALWALMNVGLSWELQPFMPQVQAVQNSGGSWGPEFFHVLALGCYAVCSSWASVTLGWVLASAGISLEEEARGQLKQLCSICLIGLSLPAAILVLLGGWTMLGTAGVVVLLPMAAYASKVLNPARLPPMYARAIARMKFGKYSEAEWEIIQQLENCEDDFEGWLMLAELYATHFHDPAEAERTVLDLCEQPRTTPSQLAVALHRLADWQLKLNGDPAAARRSLQLICSRAPGTHLARMAQLRISHLPQTKEELRAQEQSTAIPLPALGDHLDHAPEPHQFEDRAAAGRAANLCVEALKRDPDQVASREKLARIFAEHLDRADLALEQIELLLQMRDQPDNKRAEWLGLMGAWNIRFCQRHDKGREYLERLIQEYPQSPQAFAARRRLKMMDGPAEASAG